MLVSRVLRDVTTDDQNVRVFIENGMDYEIGGIGFNGTSCRWRADNMRQVCTLEKQPLSQHVEMEPSKRLYESQRRDGGKKRCTCIAGCNTFLQ